MTLQASKRQRVCLDTAPSHNEKLFSFCESESGQVSAVTSYALSLPLLHGDVSGDTVHALYAMHASFTSNAKAVMSLHP